MESSTKESTSGRSIENRGMQLAEAFGLAVRGQDKDREGQGAKGRNPIAVNRVQAQVCVCVGG